MYWCLVFFTISSLGHRLWFGYGLKIVLIIITEWCLHIIKAFSAYHLSPPVSGLGMHKKLWRDRAGRAGRSWPQGYPIAFGIMLSIYLGEEGKKGGTFGVVAFVFPSNCSVIRAFLEMAEYLPSPPEVVNKFLALFCLCGHLLHYLFNFLHLSLWFTHFYPSDFLPIRNFHSS